MKQKPPSNYCDPADIEAIEYAKQTIGDYKLKDDPNYIAPEADRMNASKKRRQILRVQNAIAGLKKNFNQKLIDLRNLKDELINTINQTNRKWE